MSDRRGPRAPRDRTGDVTVVVCAYTLGRWDQLTRTIESVCDQLRERDELVVVIDHNPELLDRTRTRFGASAVVIGNVEAKGLSGARNSGVRAALCPLVAFLDDDAWAGPGWLDALVAPFAGPDVVGTGGWAEPEWDSAEPSWFPSEFRWVVGCSYTGLPEGSAPLRNPIGCSMAFRTEAITSCGGFSHALGRVDRRPTGDEETELSIRITSQQGGTILHCPTSVVHHLVTSERSTVRYFVERCYHEGRSKAVLSRRIGTNDATSAERRYLLTLVRGVLRRLLRPSTDRRSALRQAGAIVLGFTVTVAGFVDGTVVRRFVG